MATPRKHNGRASQFQSRVYHNGMKPSQLKRYAQAVNNYYWQGRLTVNEREEHVDAINYVLAYKTGTAGRGRRPRRADIRN